MGLLDKAISVQGNRLENKKKSSLYPSSVDWIDSSYFSGQDRYASELPGQTFRPDDEMQSDFDPSHSLASLLTFLQEAKPDLQLPVELFNRLKEIFLIEQGALLLYSQNDNQFIGWAYTGIDKTTQYRLRLPMDFVDRIFREKKIVPVEIGESEREELRPYFSIREFTTLEQLHFLPFIYRDNIIGILLISEAGSSHITDPDLFAPFKKVFISLSQIIYHARSEKLEKIGSTEVKSKEHLLREINNVLQQAGDSQTTVSFLLLSLEKIILILERHVDNIDIFRTQEDIIRVITSMMPETDKIFFLDKNKLLIILSGRYHFSEEMLIHQISLALKHLFLSLGNTRLEDFTLITYPEDANKAEDVIKLLDL